MPKRSVQQKWNLLGSGQDSYAGQNAQDPRTSRKLQSWIPQEDGQLHRELAEPAYLPTTLSGPVVGLYEFDQNNGSGGVNRFYFCAARTNFTVGTKTCNFYISNGVAWTLVSAVGTLADAPMCVTQENNFFLADGASNWLFNGSIWVPVGIDIPLNQPAINMTAGSAQVYFDNTGVTAYFFPIDNGRWHGTVANNYPTSAGSASATATGNSLIFNPTQGPGGTNASPLQWATLNSSGVITGYTTPWSGAVPPFQMSVVCNLVIPTAGAYTITFQHDDGAFFGMGPGINAGNQPVCTSGGPVDVYQSLTPINGNPILGGTSKQGVWNETFVVNFAAGDTYPLEIAFAKSENAGMFLTFQITPVTISGTVPNPNPLPSTGSNTGQITAALGRYYWYTNADETVGVATESSSSPIGVVTGPITGGSVHVYQQPGLFSCSTSSRTVTGANSSDKPGPIAPALQSNMVGKVLYINGTNVGTIATVNSNSSLTLAANATATTSSGRAVICDPRCTHWNIYASESDGSKIGQYLAAVPVTQNLNTTPYNDTSPFLDNVLNTFLPVFRPVRNDRPPASKILEVHKVRQWRRKESSPNFFAFTANEEVTSGDNGDPAQCLPGDASYTVSDMVNEVSFPDQSARLRSLISHLDSLYMFSEKACYPLYGNSVDDFSIAQVVAFALGGAGRFAGKSTPNGLVFVSYDKRAFLFPTSLYSSYIAQAGASTSALIEIGKPMRNVLSQIASSRLDEVVTTYYHYGIRDWWVVSFPTSATNDTPQTWVYDFSDKGWFQLQRGFSSLSVFEVSEGNLVLIGGGVDGNTYVIDDQTGSFNNTGALPAATWQPALINFGNEEMAHVFKWLELEFDSAALATSAQITVWLDPVNVDNPGTGRKLLLKPTLGANRYLAFLTGNAVCQRMLLQVVAPSNTNAGVIRGIKLVADTLPGIITGANKPGGY
jgi:hypothetical protein